MAVPASRVPLDQIEGVRFCGVAVKVQVRLDERYYHASLPMMYAVWSDWSTPFRLGRTSQSRSRCSELPDASDWIGVYHVEYVSLQDTAVHVCLGSRLSLSGPASYARAQSRSSKTPESGVLSRISCRLPVSSAVAIPTGSEPRITLYSPPVVLRLPQVTIPMLSIPLADTSAVGIVRR